MKRLGSPLTRIAAFFILLASMLQIAHGATIFQASGTPYVAWEAEDVFQITNASPTLWVATNDATASGGRALYQAGANQTASPASYASYAIKFRTAGTYTLYLRWRADSAFTDLDPNSGNSYYRPNTLGDLTADVANFTTSAANNSRTPPAVNTYATTTESATYTVTQAQVDAGAPIILKIGTREAGMFIDRFVLSTSATLVDADINALDNSDTDVIVQGATESYVAFEAERVSVILNNAPTTWVVTNDATASGNQALYQAGVNQTASPASYASYSVKFRNAGTYTLYFRWRADSAFTDLDPNSGNSYYRPNTLGDLTADVANFATSAANNSRTPPAVNTYATTNEAVTYTVTQAQVDAGLPLTFKIGTREAGMFIDRFIFSTSATLADSDFNAIPNSGSVARPSLTKAVGSATLTTVTVTFDRPLAASSVSAAKFTLSGGVGVTSAVLNTNTSKDVILTTSTQAQGTNYTVTVNGVTDVKNNAIAPNSKVAFTAWKIASGWVTRELYLNVNATTVAGLQSAPNFPNSPDSIAWAKSVAVGSDLQFANYGARFRGFFTPAQAGSYMFYIYADDEALLSFSSNDSAVNLVPAVSSQTGSTSFDPFVSYATPNLVVGQRYLFEVLLQQGSGAANVSIGVQAPGGSVPLQNLPSISISQIATFINPDLGIINIAQQPISTTNAAGSRAKFSVTASAPSGGTLFYQWQVNQTNIAGATRPSYVTPILTSANNGNKYRCIIGVNGTDLASQEATLTVGPAVTTPLQPYVGINFSDGVAFGTTAGFALATNDVAGVVLQEFFNNIAGTTINGSQVLTDAQGIATPVTVAVWDPVAGAPTTVNGTIGTGTGNSSADSAMLQGSIANNDTPINLRLAGIPSGNYNLIVYSVGFNFNSTYEEDFALAGAAIYPTFTVRAQHAGEFVASPVLLRMVSTTPTSRDRGNYVMFENVSPAADGSLLLTVTPQSANLGNVAYFPPINALQLVHSTPVAIVPRLSASRQGTSVTLSWTAAAAGFVLESSATLGKTASWSVVSGTPNPISTAGSTNPTATGSRFYRLRK